MGKPVYLIAAHYNPRHLRRLVEALSGYSVIIHVDAKADERPFRAAVSDFSEVNFIDNRVDVMWGGWSQVAASLEMMRAANTLLGEDSYAILLSGDSYPLQPARSIADFLDQADGLQYINTVKMPSRELSKPLSRVRNRYIEYNPRNGKKNYLLRAINKIGIPRNYRKAFGTREPYAGSTWWALTGESIEWLLQEVDRDPLFVNHCKRSKMPDEFFFQTLLANSPFGSKIGRSLMFTDWTRPTGPKPAFMDHLHVEYLAAQRLFTSDLYGTGKVLFARKVGNDEEVIAGIQSTLWNSNYSAER